MNQDIPHAVDIILRDSPQYFINFYHFGVKYTFSVSIVDNVPMFLPIGFQLPTVLTPLQNMHILRIYNYVETTIQNLVDEIQFLRNLLGDNLPVYPERIGEIEANRLFDLRSHRRATSIIDTSAEIRPIESNLSEVDVPIANIIDYTDELASELILPLNEDEHIQVLPLVVHEDSEDSYEAYLDYECQRHIAINEEFDRSGRYPLDLVSEEASEYDSLMEYVRLQYEFTGSPSSL